MPARHYVISANGRHDNPDRLTVEWLSTVRGHGEYTVHLTNQTHFRTGEDLDAFTFLRQKEAEGFLKVRSRVP